MTLTSVMANRLMEERKHKNHNSLKVLWPPLHFSYCSVFVDIEVYSKRKCAQKRETFLHSSLKWLFPCELNNHDQKIRRTPMHDIREHWTTVSTLLGLISSVYRNLHHWEIKPATTEYRADTRQLKRGPGGDRVLRKECRCNLQDTFTLSGCAITIASWFNITCVRYELMAQL